MDLVILLAMNGLVWGLIVALIALGLSIIFGLLDIINVAHGDFFMVGAVLAWTMISYVDNFWLAFLIVPILGFLLGAILERVVMRPIENSASLSIVAAFGLSLVLQESVRATFGATPKRILDPIGVSVPIFDLNYEIYRLFAAGVAVVAIGAFFLFLHRTKFGTWMRAVRQDREMAVAMGVPSNLVFMATFGLGTAMAMLGGWLRRRSRPWSSASVSTCCRCASSRSSSAGSAISRARRRQRCCCASWKVSSPASPSRPRRGSSPWS